MKSIIAKYWKKVLIIIGTLFTVFNIILKITAKKNIINDYIKYGKVFHNPKIVNKIPSTVGVSTEGVTGDMVKMIIVFTVAILVVVFITSLGSRSTDKAKKK